MIRARWTWLGAATVPALLAGAATCHASDGGTANAPQSASLLSAYCRDISDKAADARLAWQTQRLKELEARVDARITLLEQRRDEVKTWVERQQSLLNAAEASLVEIYAKMDPEAAAGQLASLDVRIAASVLHQLKPREASAVLDVMKTDKAAELVRILASVTKSSAGGSAK